MPTKSASRIITRESWTLHGVFKGVLPGQGNYRVSAMVQTARPNRFELMIQSEKHTDVQIGRSGS